MIKYTKGNLLEDSAEALVNTVNEVGVMGKGIALMFKERFSENTKLYERACESGMVKVGHVFVTMNDKLWGPRWIVNFPTKRHWRYPSKLSWIKEGLADLVRVIRKHSIRSIALPPLGCGNGGLEWPVVKSEIESAMSELPDVDVRVYAPSEEYFNSPKKHGVQNLTPARALIAGAILRYMILGFECTNLEVQKLAWFLMRAIKSLKLPDPLKLKFKANRYGPYADNLRHLLHSLDGSYLHCDKRLADAGPMEHIQFEESLRGRVEEYLKSNDASVYYPAFEELTQIIDGFETPLGMELLATVDWLLYQEKCEPTLEKIRESLSKWPAGEAAAIRKMRLFDDRMLILAVERLAPGMGI